MPLYLKRIADRNRSEALEQVSDWSMMLNIAAATFGRDANAVRQLSSELQQMRRRIEMGGKETKESDLEFHRKLVDLNRRRRGRRAG